MMVEKVVTKGCQVRIYPDEDMINDIEQNIGNYRFIKNQLLDVYNQMKSLFCGNRMGTPTQYDYFGKLFKNCA